MARGKEQLSDKSQAGPRSEPQLGKVVSSPFLEA